MATGRHPRISSSSVVDGEIQDETARYCDDVRNSLGVDMANTEWGQMLVRRLDAQAAELAELRPLAAAVKRAKRAAWGSLGTAIVSLFAAVRFAVGAAGDDGDKRGAARVREEQRAQDHDALESVRASVIQNTTRIDGISSQVRTLWSLLPLRRAGMDIDQE